MIIVGVGIGPGMMTQEAGEAIRRADLIYGSRRAIDLACEHISPGSRVMEIEDYKSLSTLPEDAVVLSTGDPMLSGLGYLPGRVIPGISSLQVACARLKISELNVTPITVHGRRMDPEAIAGELGRNRSVFLLIDEHTDLEGLCQHLEENGLRKSVVALTDLGYPQERIEKGSTASPPRAPGLSCLFIGQL